MNLTGQQLADVLQRHGLVDAKAIDDPEGFDNYETLEAINATARDLKLPPNQWRETPPDQGGWWWLLQSGKLQIVQAQYRDGQIFVVRGGTLPSFSDHWINVRNIDGLWCGPLIHPSEP